MPGKKKNKKNDDILDLKKFLSSRSVKTKSQDLKQQKKAEIKKKQEPEKKGNQNLTQKQIAERLHNGEKCKHKKIDSRKIMIFNKEVNSYFQQIETCKKELKIGEHNNEKLSKAIIDLKSSITDINKNDKKNVNKNDKKNDKKSEKKECEFCLNSIMNGFRPFYKELAVPEKIFKIVDELRKFLNRYKFEIELTRKEKLKKVEENLEQFQEKMQEYAKEIKDYIEKLNIEKLNEEKVKQKEWKHQLIDKLLEYLTELKEVMVKKDKKEIESKLYLFFRLTPPKLTIYSKISKFISEILKYLSGDKLNVSVQAKAVESKQRKIIEKKEENIEKNRNKGEKEKEKEKEKENKKDKKKKKKKKEKDNEKENKDKEILGKNKGIIKKEEQNEEIKKENKEIKEEEKIKNYDTPGENEGENKEKKEKEKENEEIKNEEKNKNDEENKIEETPGKDDENKDEIKMQEENEENNNDKSNVQIQNLEKFKERMKEYTTEIEELKKDNNISKDVMKNIKELLTKINDGIKPEKNKIFDLYAIRNYFKLLYNRKLDVHDKILNILEAIKQYLNKNGFNIDVELIKNEKVYENIIENDENKNRKSKKINKEKNIINNLPQNKNLKNLNPIRQKMINYLEKIEECINVSHRDINDRKSPKPMKKNLATSALSDYLKELRKTINSNDYSDENEYKQVVNNKLKMFYQKPRIKKQTTEIYTRVSEIIKKMQKELNGENESTKFKELIKSGDNKNFSNEKSKRKRKRESKNSKNGKNRKKSKKKNKNKDKVKNIDESYEDDENIDNDYNHDEEDIENIENEEQENENKNYEKEASKKDQNEKIEETPNGDENEIIQDENENKKDGKIPNSGENYKNENKKDGETPNENIKEDYSKKNPGNEEINKKIEEKEEREKEEEIKDSNIEKENKSEENTNIRDKMKKELPEIQKFINILTHDSPNIDDDDIKKMSESFQKLYNSPEYKDKQNAAKHKEDRKKLFNELFNKNNKNETKLIHEIDENLKKLCGDLRKLREAINQTYDENTYKKSIKDALRLFNNKKNYKLGIPSEISKVINEVAEIIKPTDKMQSTSQDFFYKKKRRHKK